MGLKERTEKRLQRMRKILQNRQLDLTVVCEDVWDRHNLGAILRSCESVGVQELHVVYRTSQFHGFGHRAGASARKWMDLHRYRTHEELVLPLKERGFTLFGTHLDTNAQSIYEVDLTGPSAIVMGNEKDGISDRMLKLVDQTVIVPMHGMIQSLNVSAATAVILNEAARQRMVKGLYPARKADDPWIDEMVERWMGK